MARVVGWLLVGALVLAAVVFWQRQEGRERAARRREAASATEKAAAKPPAAAPPQAVPRDPRPPGAYLLRGRVVDGAGEPVPGASIRRRDVGIAWLDGGYEGSSEIVARTDAEGAFTVDDLKMSVYRLEAEKAGYAPGRVCAGAGDESVEIRLLPGAPVPDVVEHADSVLQLRVVRADGTPVAEHGVTVGERDHVTDAQGRLRVAFPEKPGTLAEVRVHTDEAQRLLRRSLDLRTRPAGSREEVEIRMPDLVRVTFDVEPADAPELDFVMFDSIAAPETDPAKGRYAFFVAPDQDLSYQVDAKGFVRHFVAFWRPRGGERRKIRLTRGATVRGRLVHADGRPARGRIGLEYVIDEVRGTFEIDEVQPGETTLRAYERFNDGYEEMLSRAVTLRSGEVTDVGDVVLPERFLVEGAVTAGGGVQVMAIHREHGLRGFTMTRADGRFQLWLPGGAAHHVVVAWKEGRGIALAAADRDPLRLRLRPAARARLHLPGHTFHHAVVEAAGGYELLTIGEWEGDARLLYPLPPGPLTIRVYGRDGRVLEDTIPAAPGTTTDLTFR